MSDLFSLKNRVAIVTGALGLLGKQHCFALAEAGANVVVTDLNGEDCEAFAHELGTATSTQPIGIGADITQRVSVEVLRDRVYQSRRGIDILVNNAAVNDAFENPAAAAEQSKFENYPLELWQQSLDVNITGTFLCSQVIGGTMASQGRGSIINIASTYGIVGPDQSLYSKPDGTQLFYKSPSYPTTKGAVIAFTRFLATYWAGNGVRVNALSPGGVENGQDKNFIEKYSMRTPLGRMAQPTDYKGALVFLASDASSYMTGANLVIDGGWTAW
jgi:NAD(P)-dependent dehydrogenase (short-subunit alcohol dehydrogenase family)